jgi:hypothetical protein
MPVTVAVLVFFPVWCALLWRFRGGALSALLRFDLGDLPVRLLCAVGIAAPLAILHHDWRLWVLAPAVFLGIVTSGWGPFQAMDSGKASDKSSPIGWLLDHEGLRVGVSPWRCYLGMATAGVVCLAAPAVVVGWVAGPLHGVAVAALGAAFSPIYWAAYRLHLPYRTGATLVDYTTAWAELGVGALVGGSLSLFLL